MDAESFIALRTDLQAQMAMIDDVFDALQDRATDLDPDDVRQLESVAYQIHNLYNAVEDLLKIVAAHFENNIADAARWHSALLQRMSQPVENVRPPLLSRQTYLLLDALRGFRHFFRHAYVASIEYEQLRINLKKALRVQEALRADVDRFLSSLSQSPG